MRKFNFSLLIPPLAFLVYKIFFSMSPFNPAGRYERDVRRKLDSVGIYKSTEIELLSYIKENSDQMTIPQLGTLYNNGKLLFGSQVEKMQSLLVIICIKNNAKKMAIQASNNSTAIDKNKAINMISYLEKHGFDKKSAKRICYRVFEEQVLIENRNSWLHQTFTKQQQETLLKIFGVPITNRRALKNIIDSISNYEGIKNAERIDELRGLIFTTMLDRPNYDDGITYRGYDTFLLRQYVQSVKSNDTSSCKAIREYMKDYMSTELIADIDDQIRRKRKVAYLDTLNFKY